jgi:uncharacterized protein YecT (DUF1311 family)
MSRNTVAFVVFAITFSLPIMAFCEDVAATSSDAEILSRDAETVKACLDFVEFKQGEDETVRREKDAANGAAASVSPNVATGEPRTGPEAYLEAAAQSRPHFAAENCIGIVSDACLATDDGQGTVGLMECYGREREVWDTRLNARYREQTAISSDKPEEEMVAKHLLKVQTSWINWRDATCEVLYLDGIPLYGSDAKIEGVYCDMVLTAHQALWMEGKMVLSFDAPSDQ